ncbi:D-3-phosphoglycerate dehydrogenase, partial [Globisporangium splendens]
MSATTKKLRVLCLHGFRTNVKVMQNQTATLRALLGDDAEFTFLNGPYKAKGPSAEGIRRQYSNDAPFYEWCALGYVQGLDKDKEDADAAKTEWRELYIGFEKTAEFLDAHLRQHGPYDVVIGFSQGAAVLTILSMIYLRKQPSQRWWNLCVCVGGVPVRDVSMRPLFEKPNGELILLPFPSIHIMGRKDSLYKDSIQLAAMYEDRPAGSVMKKLVFEHNGGHNFPPAKHNPGFYENLADLIRQHCGLRPTSAQPKRVALYASLTLSSQNTQVKARKGTVGKRATVFGDERTGKPKRVCMLYCLRPRAHDACDGVNTHPLEDIAGSIIMTLQGRQDIDLYVIYEELNFASPSGALGICHKRSVSAEEAGKREQQSSSSFAAVAKSAICLSRSPRRMWSKQVEEDAWKEALEGDSATTAAAAMAVPSSQHEEGGAPDPVRTNEPDQVNAGAPDESGTNEVDPSGGDDAMTGRHDKAPTTVEGVHKAAATETASQKGYEALTAKMRGSPNAVNRVEIEYEVRTQWRGADALVDLFRLLAIEKGESFPEWKRTIQELCKDMHRPSWTMVALIQKRIDQNRLAAETKASPWGSQTSTNSQTNVQEQGTQPFTFKSDKYSEEEQHNMIRHCKQKFEYSVTLRQPTTMEWEIMLAIVEGELLIRHLPQFLRRVCDGDTLFRFQNTIAAQVEGELVGKLSDATQVYKDHQSTGRIVEAILQAARYRNDGKMEETMAMLKDLKAAEYNDSTHSLHFYFFDRSTAAKWNKMTIPFRRQLVQLISAHQTETTGERPEANNVWNRQLGADGLQNAESRSRYKIQLLNTARSVNMSLFLEYLKQTTGKRFYAYPLDKYGPISHQSQLWEVLFEEESCPKALIDVRRIIWRGRTIILHHASKYRMAPCLICGAAGHFARAYDEIVSKLPRKPATFTSAAEIKERESSRQGENEPSENTNPVTPDETNTSSPQPNSNPNNLTKNVSFTVKTEISVQQTGNLKEQAKAKPNDGAANAKGPASKASQKNGPRQISKDDIRWAKELMRFRRDMDELMKVHVERQTELNPNRNDIMDWDGEYTIQDVMDANGLAEATTPPTGNCQFYAVAEAVLQITHDNMANEKLLEATASRIKQSMNAATRLNFDLEFPEGAHLGILEALGRGDRKMSPKEKRADTLDYFSDIASSSSSRSSTLPGSLWGGPESLRMAAKALQRKIFVLIETTYGDRKGFAIYKPQSRVHGGGQFLSAKEYACTEKQWEDELRQDRNEAAATSSPLPIVMKFANEHYNSLHFRTFNDPTPLANMTSSSLAKHLQGSVRSKTEFKTDRSGQFEDERETDDSMEDSDNSSLGENAETSSARAGALGMVPGAMDLAQVLREQVIEEALKRLSYRTDQAETRVWITSWFDKIATTTTKQQRAALLNSKEDWSTLGKMKHGGLEVLRLYHPTQQEKLSRYIICTVVELKAAFKSGEELSEWSALSVIMVQVTMEVDSVEPSRSCPNTLRVLTQNVCGFKKKERTKWLEDLKGALTAEKYDIIYLQETRITTAKEERRLRQYWNRIWGITNLDEPTSFWSIHPDATGGVAILTNPKTISEAQLIEESKWTNRTIAIKSKGVVWINVYAPNKKPEREHFFRRLNEELVTHRAAAVLGGDFNCVLDKQRDRYQRGVLLPMQCGSAELRRLVTEWNIYDSRELVEDPEWPVQREPTEHFTYWRKNSASRLDRFYIAGNLGSAVQWEAIELPKRYSDHQAVVLHLKWTSQPQRPRNVNKCRHPIRTSRPDLVRIVVQKAIAHELEQI